MNTSNLLHAAYITIFTLGLSSTPAQSEELFFVTDDDTSIANIGVDYGSLPHTNTSSITHPDDDDAIANIGDNHEPQTHEHTISVVLPNDDEEDIANIGAS